MIHEAPFAAEFAMSDADFERIRSLIEMRAGIQLSESKRSMVYNRLARRLRDTGCPSFAKYLEAMRPFDSQLADIKKQLSLASTRRDERLDALERLVQRDLQVGSTAAR